MNNVTLKQVAELSGKSEATVSLVLNSRQYHRVSPRTRQLIQSIAEKLGYIPNMQAQALVKGRTRNIAVTANGLTPFYNEYIRRITHLLEARNYNVFAFETMLSPNRERQVVNWVRQGLFDGCICLEYNHYTREFYEPDRPRRRGRCRPVSPRGQGVGLRQHRGDRARGVGRDCRSSGNSRKAGHPVRPQRGLKYNMFIARRAERLCGLSLSRAPAAHQAADGFPAY